MQMQAVIPDFFPPRQLTASAEVPACCASCVLRNEALLSCITRLRGTEQTLLQIDS